MGEFKKGSAEGEKLAYEKVKEVAEGIKREEPKKVESPKT